MGLTTIKYFLDLIHYLDVSKRPNSEIYKTGQVLKTQRIPCESSVDQTQVLKNYYKND